MTRHYPDMGNAFDWSYCERNLLSNTQKHQRVLGYELLVVGISKLKFLTKGVISQGNQSWRCKISAVFQGYFLEFITKEVQVPPATQIKQANHHSYETCPKEFNQMFCWSDLTSAKFSEFLEFIFNLLRDRNVMTNKLNFVQFSPSIVLSSRATMFLYIQEAAYSGIQSRLLEDQSEK